MQLPIIYGSQTGNAAFLSELVRKALLYGYNEFSIYNEPTYTHNDGIIVCEADGLEIQELLKCEYIIILCATHGDGCEAYNIKNLWNFLKLKELPTNFLSNIKFSIYGLGDSSFDKFNFFAKKMCNRLKALGANEIIARVDGDAQDKEGYMTTFKPWLKKIYEYFKDIKFDGDQKNIKYVNKPTHTALVTNKSFVTPESYSNPILRLEIAINKYNDFKPGDCIGIRPHNYNYEEFMQHNFETLYAGLTLNSNLKENYSIEQVEELIKTNFDINNQPQQIIFLYLHNEIIKNKDTIKKSTIEENILLQKLMEIYTDYDVYYDYLIQPKRTFFEVLIEFKITISFLFLVKYIPKICIRYFTTAKVNISYHVNIALVNYKTRMSKNRVGLCSEYIKAIKLYDTMEIVIAKGTLNFSCRRLLFICTGTGVTLPYSAMKHFSDKKIVLFYGFREKKVDQMYFNEMIESGNNYITIFSAPSREEPKKYVQDVFEESCTYEISKYSIIISGNTRLTKIFKNLFKKLYPEERILFQSETW